MDDIQALDDNLLSMIFSPVLLAVHIMQDSDDYLGIPVLWIPGFINHSNGAVGG